MYLWHHPPSSSGISNRGSERAGGTGYTCTIPSTELAAWGIYIY